jgi:acyl carrier protein
MNIEADIRAYIAANLLFSDDGFHYSDDASFLREGIIDSLGVMELVTFAGSQFGIEVSPHEVTPENFDSVIKLAAYVRRKQDGSKELIAA